MTSALISLWMIKVGCLEKNLSYNLVNTLGNRLSERPMKMLTLNRCLGLSEPVLFLTYDNLIDSPGLFSSVSKRPCSFIHTPLRATQKER